MRATAPTRERTVSTRLPMPTMATTAPSSCRRLSDERIGHDVEGPSPHHLEGLRDAWRDRRIHHRHVREERRVRRRRSHRDHHPDRQTHAERRFDPIARRSFDCEAQSRGHAPRYLAAAPAPRLPAALRRPVRQRVRHLPHLRRAARADLRPHEVVGARRAARHRAARAARVAALWGGAFADAIDRRRLLLWSEALLLLRLARARRELAAAAPERGAAVRRRGASCRR